MGGARQVAVACDERSGTRLVILLAQEISWQELATNNIFLPGPWAVVKIKGDKILKPLCNM